MTGMNRTHPVTTGNVKYLASQRLRRKCRIPNRLRRTVGTNPPLSVPKEPSPVSAELTTNWREVLEYQRRLKDMQDFLETMNGVFNMVLKVGSGGVRRLATALTKLAR